MRVAAIVPNMPETIVAFLAVASLGGIWSSCSPDFGERGILDRFGQIGPRVLVVADGYYYAGKTIHLADKIRAVLKEQPDSVEALNNLAWILATCADAKLRNGEEAISHADKAWKLTGGKEATMLGTLGAAYAEAGQFTNAITASQQAIELAQSSGNTGFARVNQQLQQLYRSGRAYHEKPRTSPATNTTPTR